MMDPHESYHENITGQEALKRLKTSGKGRCYLTRYSDKHNCYILSVYKPVDACSHFKIIKDNGKCQINGKKKEFDDIGKLLDYYEKNNFDPAFVMIGQYYTKEEFQQAEEEERRRQEELEQEIENEGEEENRREEIAAGEQQAPQQHGNPPDVQEENQPAAQQDRRKKPCLIL